MCSTAMLLCPACTAPLSASTCMYLRYCMIFSTATRMWWCPACTSCTVRTSLVNGNMLKYFFFCTVVVWLYSSRRQLPVKEKYVERGDGSKNITSAWCICRSSATVKWRRRSSLVPGACVRPYSRCRSLLVLQQQVGSTCDLVSGYWRPARQFLER